MEIEARIIESLPNALYKIEYDGKEYICHLSGKMRMNRIACLVGDRVRVVLDKYGGKTTNRITRRL
jgi:translation initiation factor IF-1